MTDYRIFREGKHKSHIYVSGENNAVCGSQTLRHYESEELPKVTLDDNIADMCQKCAKAVWIHQL